MADVAGYLADTGQPAGSMRATGRVGAIQVAVDVDMVQPVITGITPPLGQLPGTREQARRTPIQLDVTDANPGLRLVVLTLQYADRPEILVVHDGDDFVAPFDSDTSARTMVIGGYRYVILPRGGWRTDLASLRVYAVDTAGNVENEL